MKLRHILASMMSALFPGVEGIGSHARALEGHRLTHDQITDLEASLAKNPHQIEARLLLLGKYGSEQYANDDFARRRVRHIRWIVENKPEHPIAGEPYCLIVSNQQSPEYQEIRELWLKQTEKYKTRPAVLSNAAHYFSHYDKELAERCLLRALQIKPRSSDLRHALAHLYSLWDGHEQQAFEQQKAICGNAGHEKFYELTDLPELAFSAGKIDEAQHAADRLLALAEENKTDWNYGNAINQAHTVLGRVALLNKDVKTACDHLRQSIINIATPQTTSFGPTLDLAKELQAAGQKEAVLVYLDEMELLCGVCNQWAFELRYEAEHGQSRREADRDGYEDAFLDHQFTVLARNEAVSRKHLVKAIETTKRSIAVLSKFTNIAENKDKEGMQRQMNRLEQHLSRLKQL